MKKNLAQKQRRLVKSLRLVLSAFFLSISVLNSSAQTTYPAFQSLTKPSPEPAAPGDAFTPPISGNPNAHTPEVAEWTRTAGPNESIVLTGFNLSRHTAADAAKDTRFFIYGRNNVTREARVQRVDDNKAIITLPKDIPAWSTYLIWPGNEAGYGRPIAVNKTESWWVGPDRATRGATVSVFGRNLAQNNDTLRSYIYIKAVGGGGQWANVTRVNPYRVDFTIPSGLVNGEYEVWAHNGHGGQYGWAEPQKITIADATQWTSTVFNVKNYGATGNGSTDDTHAIRKAIDAARQSPGATLYFPAGNYMISNYLHIYNNVKWIGDGKTATTIKCASNFSSIYGMVFGNVSNTFSISDMGFDTNKNFGGNKPIVFRDCKDVWINNVRFDFRGFNLMDLHHSYRVFMTNTDHIGITTFLGDCSQLFIDRNNFYMTNDSDMALHTWGGVGVSITRSTCRDLDNSNPLRGDGWGKGRFYVGNGSWGSNRMTYLAFNKTYDLTPRPASDVDQNSGEQFLWEGNLSQYAGFVSSSTATSTTLPNFSSDKKELQYAVIIKGKGLGQSRLVLSSSGNTIFVKEPWNVIPDGTSRIVVGDFADRIAIYKNSFDGKDRSATHWDHIAAAAVEPFGGTFNVIADNNTMHQLRQGIANWSTQHHTGLDPNYFNLYSNNKMTEVRWGMYNEVSRIYRQEGVAMLGVIYRNNTVNGAILAGFYNSTKTEEPILEASVSEHNTVSNTPEGLVGSTAGAANQFFYNNTFSGVGTALTITPKMILRENNYLGVTNLYTFPYPKAINSVIEAPLHVIDMAGSAAGKVIKTSFTLQNAGIEPMNWAVASNAPWLTFSALSGTITDERGLSIIELSANPANLAVGNHSATITVTAGEQVKKYTVLLKLTSPQNEIAITSPTANAVLSTSQAVTINANANNPDAAISKVEFFAGSFKLGEDLTSPYSFSWNNPTAGNQVLTAKSVTSSGTTTSEPVNVNITSNAPPTVAITSPGANSNHSTPASILINVNAADRDGTISKVEFFNGTTKLGETGTAPYAFNWYNVELGSYTITAKATDNNGLSSVSAPIVFNVRKSNAPTVTLTSPGINSSIKAPTNVYLSAQADYVDGTITKVEFFHGSTRIVERTYAPYETYWLNVPTGSYTITARATNNLGVTTTSAPVRLDIVSQSTTINSSPTVSITSPTTTSKFTGPANVTINTNSADGDGSVKKMEFFNGSIKIGESETSPFNFTWNNVAAGTYTLNVRATDNAGTSTSSAPITFTVNNLSNLSNASPTVSLTSPTENTSLNAGTNISLEALAADADGTISKVEFFNGTTKIGEDFTSPYNITWSNVASGNYALSARAFDNNSASTSSSPVNINVGSVLKVSSAPTVAITSPVAGSNFSAPATITFGAMAADADGSVTKVEFYNGQVKLGESSSSPYVFSWTGVAAGTYSITARATDNGGLNTTSAPVWVTVNATSTASCSASGSILREYWSNVSGTSVSAIPLATPPTATSQLSAFEAPSNVADNYGQRIRGFICAPITGSYTFYIAADDDSELWLSTNDDPANKQRIASVTGFTNVREWNKFSSQKSVTIQLQANTKYYIEALHNEGGGGDNLAVGWSIPGSASITVIPGSVLSPATSSTVLTSTPITTTSCSASGSILREYWSNVSGTSVSAIPLATPPTATSQLSAFEAPSNVADNYGQRIRGFICAPITGSYTFYIAADDDSELWLSTNDDPANKQRIASVTGFTNVREWNKFSSQKSVTIQLQANTKYYIEALHNEGGGGDNLAVGWSIPGSASITVIPGSVLSPATSSTVLASTPITTTSCSASGSILREYWSNVSGTSVSAIPLATPPTATSQLSAFEAPSNVADNYGQRIRGFICAPITGSYTFYIAADDDSELWLSTNDDPANKQRIASVTGFTNVREWNKFSSQKSVTIQLQANTKYYIEALHNEGGGGDNLAVGWSIPGSASITVIPGSVLSPATSSTVLASTPITTTSCSASGSILREFWSNVNGTSVSAIPFSSAPTATSQLSAFEAPSNVADSYGQRIRGFICAPITGSYTFYLAADDDGELWLSTNDDPANKQRIAFVSGWTSPREWTKLSSQKSVTIQLQANTKYYIEALHHDGGGGDNLAVGWSIPGSASITVIPGSVLSPATTNTNNLLTTAKSFKDQEMYAGPEKTFRSYPNPFTDKVTIEFSFNQKEEYQVMIYNVNGSLIKVLKSGTAVANTLVQLEWADEKIPAGVYLVKLVTGETVKTLQVVRR